MISGEEQGLTCTLGLWVASKEMTGPYSAFTASGEHLRLESSSSFLLQGLTGERGDAPLGSSSTVTAVSLLVVIATEWGNSDLLTSDWLNSDPLASAWVNSDPLTSVSFVDISCSPSAPSHSRGDACSSTHVVSMETSCSLSWDASSADTASESSRDAPSVLSSISVVPPSPFSSDFPPLTPAAHSCASVFLNAPLQDSLGKSDGGVFPNF